MKNILFLCTGNSCRSQMAEAWGSHLLSKKINFYSAGTKKHGLNPFAVKVMAEAGVDISSHFSKLLSEVRVQNGKALDLIVTVCGDAQENCPLVIGQKTIHFGFDDPPRLTEGFEDQEQILQVYRRVRDEIKDFVLSLEVKTQETARPTH